MYHTRFDNAIANNIQNLDKDCKDELWYLDRTTALRRSFELRQHSAASDKTAEAAQLSFFSSRSQSPVYGWSRLDIETGSCRDLDALRAYSKVHMLYVSACWGR